MSRDSGVRRAETLNASIRWMDHPTLFGLIAVTAMLVFYALEDHSPWFILAFAIACALGLIYGFLQGVAVRHRRSYMGRSSRVALV